MTQTARDAARVRQPPPPTQWLAAPDRFGPAELARVEALPPPPAMAPATSASKRAPVPARCDPYNPFAEAMCTAVPPAGVATAASYPGAAGGGAAARR